MDSDFIIDVQQLERLIQFHIRVNNLYKTLYKKSFRKLLRHDLIFYGKMHFKKIPTNILDYYKGFLLHQKITKYWSHIIFKKNPLHMFPYDLSINMIPNVEVHEMKKGLQYVIYEIKDYSTP